MICDICDGDPCPHPSFCHACRRADRKLRKVRVEASAHGTQPPHPMPPPRVDKLTGKSLW